ncbi:uncharacterized protein [Vicugna pacos]|uniref:Histone H2B n=1 Tax=Vicugna pacos TaxID=30538 RepID=A0ABM5CTS3_VICPA
MFRVVFLSTVIHRRQERQRRVRILGVRTKTPPTGSNTCLSPTLGSGPPTYAGRGSLRPPTPRRVWSPPPPPRPLLQKAHHFPGRPCHAGLSRSGRGGAGRWCGGPGSLPRPPWRPTRPTPSPTWTSPGGWLLGVPSSRCPAVTCRQTPRQALEGQIYPQFTDDKTVSYNNGYVIIAKLILPALSPRDCVSLLARSDKRSTITSREIQTSVRLLLPGEMGKHAMSEGTKAAIRYTTRK